MIIETLNCLFFLCVVVPKLINATKHTWKFLTLLDCIYTNIWDKILFCIGIASFAIKQWMKNNVRQVGKNTYEISFMVQGEISKIIVEKTIPEIVDIQNKETDESYMEKLAPFVKFQVKKWVAPEPSVIYYENGETDLC